MNAPSADTPLALVRVIPVISTPAFERRELRSWIPVLSVQRKARHDVPALLLSPTTTELSSLTSFATDPLPPGRTPKFDIPVSAVQRKARWTPCSSAAQPTMVEPLPLTALACEFPP